MLSFSISSCFIFLLEASRFSDSPSSIVLKSSIETSHPLFFCFSVSRLELNNWRCFMYPWTVASPFSHCLGVDEVIEIATFRLISVSMSTSLLFSDSSLLNLEFVFAVSSENFLEDSFCALSYRYPQGSTCLADGVGHLLYLLFELLDAYL